MIAKKQIKAAKKTVKKIRKTARKVNKRMLKSNKKLVSSTLDNVNERIEGINIGSNLNKAKSTAKEATDFTLKATDDAVDGAFTNGKKTLALTEKAIKGSLKLAERQQEIMFETLETVKDQFSDSRKKLKELLLKKQQAKQEITLPITEKHLKFTKHSLLGGLFLFNSHTLFYKKTI